jgi:Na+/H+ antiporter NhaA
MVQQRIQSGLKLAESTNSRKRFEREIGKWIYFIILFIFKFRNAQADSRQTDSSDDGAKIKPGVKHSSAIPQFGTSKSEIKSK